MGKYRGVNGKDKGDGRKKKNGGETGMRRDKNRN